MSDATSPARCSVSRSKRSWPHHRTVNPALDVVVHAGRANHGQHGITIKFRVRQTL